MTYNLFDNSDHIKGFHNYFVVYTWSRIKVEGIHKFEVRTTYAHYEFVVLPFNLIIAANIIQYV